MNKDELKQKVNKIVDELADTEQGWDVFDVLGILVSDVADIRYAKSNSEFMKQKKDLKQTLKKLYRLINNATYKTFVKKD